MPESSANLKREVVQVVKGIGLLKLRRPRQPSVLDFPLWLFWINLPWRSTTNLRVTESMKGRGNCWKS